MTALESVSQLRYHTKTINQALQRAALDAATQCGYDRTEESLLHSKIDQIRWLAPACAQSFFADFLLPEGEWSANEIVQVDWHTWAISNQFDAGYEESVVERVESIVVSVPILLSGEVFSYGLGPEYNWLHWEEAAAAEQELPNEVFDALQELIANEWSSLIIDHAEGNDDYLSGIHPRLQAAVAAVLCEGE
jgi:hypothetical protein